MNNKKGSSAVLLTVTFVFLVSAVVAAIGLARRIAVSSECRVFGEVWTKAILSEYDVHLLSDYGIMAFQGPDSEVDERIDIYKKYSVEGKLNANVTSTNSELYGFELNNPENFKKAIKKSAIDASVSAILNHEGRTKIIPKEGENEEERVILNKVVKDTLPSSGIENGFDADSVADSIGSGNIGEFIAGKIGSSLAEMQFIHSYMNSHLSKADDKPTYFKNELEYIAVGKLSDEKNYSSCKRRIFLMRNALNLAYLASDPEKMSLVTAVSEIIAPGPGGLLVKALITEAWAVAESDYDLDTLISGGRIPAVKTAKTWHTDLETILKGGDLRKKLSDEEKKLLDENMEDILKNEDGSSTETVMDGQNYDDYVMLLILLQSENVRLLRIMDIVQINMKYRYYEDFNMNEYFTGVRFNYNANGKNYEFEEEYQ